MTEPLSIYWIRRDFRLYDNPALVAAARLGAVLPVVVVDDAIRALGAAPKWRWEAGLAAFARAFGDAGLPLVILDGPARAALLDLVARTGAQSVHWNRLYDEDTRARDTDVKAALRAQGIDAQSHNAHLLFEPWEVETGTGGFYRVYSPFWRAVEGRVVAPCLDRPALRAPDRARIAGLPMTQIAALGLSRAMNRGAQVLAQHAVIGEAEALSRADRFFAQAIDGYKSSRDFLHPDTTSHLSENLALGEISPRQLWHRARAAQDAGAKGAEHFCKELVWREFAYHLLYHSPQITRANWRPEWDHFPWETDANSPAVLAWKQGRTGLPVVDAAMREMYITGRMHNRARMLVASYLTKHMMVHWRIGLDWFAECLTDWDIASNAMGWQWTAGSGPDAAPYFRIFNPETQAEKFDPHGRYQRRYLAEIARPADPVALSFFEAIPRSWGLAPDQPYPTRPIVDLAEGRARALAAYEARHLGDVQP